MAGSNHCWRAAQTLETNLADLLVYNDIFIDK